MRLAHVLQIRCFRSRFRSRVSVFPVAPSDGQQMCIANRVIQVHGKKCKLEVFTLFYVSPNYKPLFKVNSFMLPPTHNKPFCQTTILQCEMQAARLKPSLCVVLMKLSPGRQQYIYTVHIQEKPWYTANGRQVGLFCSYLHKACVPNKLQCISAIIISLGESVAKREATKYSEVLNTSTFRCNTVKRSSLQS